MISNKIRDLLNLLAILLTTSITVFIVYIALGALLVGEVWFALATLPFAVACVWMLILGYQQIYEQWSNELF